MSGLFNSFYYGKAGKADFTPDQLPKNRLELFFTTLRVQLSKLITLNLLYDLFCLPLFAWLWINVSLINSYSEGLISGSFLEDGYFSLFLIGLIPCLMIMSVGSAGQMYVLRNWSRDQHSFLWSDFKDSLKLNWKPCLGLGTINGVSFLIVFVCYYYYGSMAQTNLFFVVPQVLVVLLGAIWWMMNMLSFPMVVSYEMKLSQVLRNSALMAVARLPFSVLYLLLTFGVPLAILAFVPYGDLILILYFVLIGFSVTGLIYASYANSCFDKYLNPRIEGAKVGQGMRDPALDFKDADEEEEIRKEADSMK